VTDQPLHAVPVPGIDKARIEAAVREILAAIGEDLDRDGLRFTPRRIADMYEEIFAGLHDDPSRHLVTTFEAEHDEMVMVRDIPLYSVCVPSKERINTPTGVKRASAINEGDVLWTFDEDGALTTTTVVSVGWRHARELVEVSASDHSFRVTPEHPILTPNGWVKAGQLVPGDKVRFMEPRRMCQERYPVFEGYHLGYVLGAIGSDASVQDGRRISLVVRDEAFAQRFAVALEAAFDIAAHVEAIKVPSGYLERLVPMYRVRIVSSYIGRLVLQWFGGSKGTKDFHFPRVVLRSREMMDGFLDGYCDGDGYDTKRNQARSILTSNTDFAHQLAALLGTKPVVHNKKGMWSVYVSKNWHRSGWYGRPGYQREDVPLLPGDAGWVEIESIRGIAARGGRPFRVYSIDCEPHSTFLVSGVQVKNCEHHLVPFAGRAHVAYIPGEDGRITGLSKLARLVDGLAKKPQVQERLTTEIADALMDALDPLGVFVVIEAEHLCMSMRGIKKPGSLTITSAVRGLFKENPATRAEAMSFLGQPGLRP
jgi:GTP cyclohydrolase I